MNVNVEAINFASGAGASAQPARDRDVVALATPSNYHPDAVKACASLNTSTKLGLMRGYGEIDT